MYYGLFVLLTEEARQSMEHQESECSTLWKAFLGMCIIQVPIVVGAVVSYLNQKKMRRNLHGMRGDMQTVANKLAVKEAAEARLQIPQHLDVHISGTAGQTPATPQPSQSAAHPATPPPAPVAREQPPPPPQDSSSYIP